jgi:hypothetical protein
MNIANLRSDPDFLALLGIRFRISRGLLTSMLRLSGNGRAKKDFNFSKLVSFGSGLSFSSYNKQPINQVSKTPVR